MRILLFLVAILTLLAPTVNAAPALTSFQIQLDAKGNQNTLIPNASKWVDARVLAAGVAETVTVPAAVAIVSFSATENFYVNFSGGTAAVPVADVTNGSAAELNPGIRYVKGQGTFSILSPATCIVTLSFYK